MNLTDRCQPFMQFVQGSKLLGIYPYFRPISRSWGTEVEVGGRRLIMVGSNDYLGLTHEPRVMEAATQVWRTCPGGSRFLCSNLTMHEALEFFRTPRYKTFGLLEKEI